MFALVENSLTINLLHLKRDELSFITDRVRVAERMRAPEMLHWLIPGGDPHDPCGASPLQSVEEELAEQ